MSGEGDKLRRINVFAEPVWHPEQDAPATIPLRSSRVPNLTPRSLTGYGGFRQGLDVWIPARYLRALRGFVVNPDV